MILHSFVVLEIITNNPFRILGVFTNSRPTDIVRNVGRIKAYTSVGKEVSFPSDFTDCLGPVCRDNDSVQAAQSRISTYQDRIRFSLFWFISENERDTEALQLLWTGDQSGALQVWMRGKESPSSFHNRALLHLINGDIKKAINLYMRLFHWGNYRDPYLSMFVEDSFSFTAFDLSKLLIEELLQTIDPKELLNVFRLVEDVSYTSTPFASFATQYQGFRIATFQISDGQKYKRCVFKGNDGVETLVGFSIYPGEGELTPSEIMAQKDHLFVVKYSFGLLLSDWDYSLSSEIDFIKEIGSSQPASRIQNSIGLLKKTLSDGLTGPFVALNDCIRETHRDLLAIKELVGEEDTLYSSLAEKISKTIVQGLPICFHDMSFSELEKCARINAYMVFSKTLSASESIIQRCDELQNDVRAIQASCLTRLPALVMAEEQDLRSLLETYYKMSVIVDDHTVVTVDETGKHVSKRAFEKPHVYLERVRGMSIDAFLHRCAPLLLSIKHKLEPELDSYYLFSTQIVRGFYNELVDGVNRRLKWEEEQYDKYLSLRAKYAETSEYIEAKYILNPIFTSGELGDLLYLEREYGEENSPYVRPSYTVLRHDPPTKKTTKQFKEYLGRILSDMNNLARFDMETDFRTRFFEPNHRSLRDLFLSIDGWSVTTIKEADIDMMTEREKEIIKEEERKSKTLWGRIKKNFLS